MRIELRDSGIPISEPLREHVRRKLTFALRRFAPGIDKVVVRLTDLNGPKGGPDKRCRMVAFLSRPARLVAEATDADAYVAVSQAALRLDERIARSTSKRRTKALSAPLPDGLAVEAPPVPTAEPPSTDVSPSSS